MSRTCVVCRQVVEVNELLRFCLSPQVDSRAQELAVDIWKGKHSRGAYCHARQKCVFDRRIEKALGASLKCSGRVQSSEALLRSALSLLESANTETGSEVVQGKEKGRLKEMLSHLLADVREGQNRFLRLKRSV